MTPQAASETLNEYGWPTQAVRQVEGSADCVGCVAAMATGTSLEAFKAWCGQEVGPYSDLTLAAYLLAHGILMGVGFALGEPVRGVTSVEFLWKAEGQAAYLGVKSKRYEGVGHAVLWNGERVLDPNEEDSQRLRAYEIEVVWPLYRLPRQEAPDPRKLVEVPETKTMGMRILELEAEVAALRAGALR